MFHAFWLGYQVGVELPVYEWNKTEEAVVLGRSCILMQQHFSDDLLVTTKSHLGKEGMSRYAHSPKNRKVAEPDVLVVQSANDVEVAIATLLTARSAMQNPTNVPFVLAQLRFTFAAKQIFPQPLLFWTRCPCWST